MPRDAQYLYQLARGNSRRNPYGVSRTAWTDGERP